MLPHSSLEELEEPKCSANTTSCHNFNIFGPLSVERYFIKVELLDKLRFDGDINLIASYSKVVTKFWGGGIYRAFKKMMMASFFFFKYSFKENTVETSTIHWSE